MKEIIRLENIKRNFIVGDEVVHALRGVSFTIYALVLRFMKVNLLPLWELPDQAKVHC